MKTLEMCSKGLASKKHPFPITEDGNNNNGDDVVDDHKKVISGGYFPEEIVEDILVRLPVKPLVRFKAVSKPWYALISDPQFAKSHFRMSNKRVRDDDNFNLIERHGVICFDRIPSRPCLSLISLKEEHRGGGGGGAAAVRLLDNPFREDQACDLQLLGSCDGLLFVCVASEDNFLWNPCTGETKKLSSKSDYPSSFNFLRHRITGLGYDSSLNEYKAVIAFRIDWKSPPKFGVPDSLAVSVVCGSSGSKAAAAAAGTSSSSCGTSSGNDGTTNMQLKYFPEFPYCVSYTKDYGLTLNGNPHWAVCRITQQQRRCHMNKTIVCFDVLEESFQDVSLPDSITKDFFFDIAVIQGLLCVVDNTMCDGFHVWGMKEYGIKESWTKLFVIPMPSGYFNPLGFIKNSQLLIHINKKKLLVYDVQTGNQDYIFSSQSTLPTFAATFVESLVSP